jgi:hypothetical protein
MRVRSLKQKGDQKTTDKTRNDWKMTEDHKAKSGYAFKRVKLSREDNRLYRLATLCCVLAALYCLLAAPALADAPEKNGYIADKPLETYSHETIKGGLYYSVGDSYYSSKIYPGDVYTVSHEVELPEGATVKFARLYNYWTWSAEVVTGLDPKMKLSFNGNELKPEKEYSDRKGWGIYNYPTGTWAYDVTPYVNGSGTFSTNIENIGSENSFVCIDGAGLLIVYSDPNGKDVEYWINEGADMLDSQMDENGNPLYYATPSDTICELLKPTLQLPIGSATLTTICQSGNWMNSTLRVNEETFPGITDGQTEGREYHDLDTDTRDITKALKSGENSILFQNIGDYVVPSGALLVIEKDPQAKEGAQTSSEGASEKSEETGKTQEASGAGANKAPGLGFGFTLVLLAAGKLVAGQRQKKARK